MGPTDQPRENRVERDLQNCKMIKLLLQATKSVLSHLLEQERTQRETAHKAESPPSFLLVAEACRRRGCVTVKFHLSLGTTQLSR